MPDISHLLRPDIAALEPYTPIVPLEVLAERLGRPINQIIKLDANENPYGASPRALEALASYPHYAIYPDPEHTALRAALSAYTGQPAERLICGAGSDELIDLLMRAFLMPGDAIINCGPTFGMYPFDAQLFAAKVISVPRTETFAVDIEAVADAAQAHGAKMVFLANPNNPTGTLTPRAEIERLLELPMLVVVDEAYAEFAGQSLIDMVGSYPNLVVLRTFSKWAGLAGLRVGYAAVPGDLIAHLWKIKQPYNVNCAAEQAALASLADLPYLQGLIDQIVAERGRLMAALAELPLLRPFPSSSNFVLCRVAAEPGAGPQRAMAIKRHLEERGILIRYYTAPALADCIRISVGRPEQNDALLAALRELA